MRPENSGRIVFIDGVRECFEIVRSDDLSRLLVRHRRLKHVVSEAEPSLLRTNSLIFETLSNADAFDHSD